MAAALSSLAASIDRLAKAIDGQGRTSGKLYSTMEPLKEQTLAESIKYLGDMLRPLETHSLAGSLRELADKLAKQR
jgi:hypothetical protein